MNFQFFFTRKRTRLQIERTNDDLLFAFAVLGFIAVFIDVGNLQSAWSGFFDTFYHVCLVIFLLLFSGRAYLDRFVFKKRRERWLVLFEIGFIVVLLLGQVQVGFLEQLDSREYLQFAISIIFLVEISRRSLGLERLKVNPALLFLFSFILLILIGTFGLMLPVSTAGGIRFIDALFTSTSAVCVTGLTVLDTGTEFTRFGQNVILGLISLGGLGVMTFTSFFGVFFKGETSFRNQMIYKDFTGQDALRGVFSTIVKIVSLTLGIELAGAMILFSCLNPIHYSSVAEQFYFAMFHAVSAFNNAGFQLKAAGLYDETLRFNYAFQTTISFLVIFGGLGFFIVFNIVNYAKERLQMRTKQVFLGEPCRYIPWVLNFNSIIVLRTTLILLIAGAVIFFLTEYHHALKEHTSFFGKTVVSFFCSVTPRTAGFNNIDMATLSREGILFTMLFMWIGASPGSTGGGIKTTTFAVATLGIFNIARGRDHIEVGKREVAKESLMRAFIVICLSLIALGFSSLTVGYFNPELDLVKIVFECFSAFGTVGLSLGITSQLSDMSKIVIVLTMFVGRVGTYTLLVGLLKKAADARLYKFPVENVIIT